MTTRNIPPRRALSRRSARPRAASAQPETTEPASLRLVKVTLSATGARSTRKQLERGTIAQFDIRNVSKVPLRSRWHGPRPCLKPGKTTQMFFVHLDVPAGRRGGVAAAAPSRALLVSTVLRSRVRRC